ncbi:MAG: ABC transporter permease [Mesorhizobium sp.]|uniref:ABC transporter permease n=1 Tax=Mesorhizobium sp. TaxID=1871066 RepID=UPI000FE7359C|nr:ABC transporter permease [Mesorhizobium sp.]RWL17935.1 MAG: ABC transporter permease [Mesorhizobium sp.]
MAFSFANYLNSRTTSVRNISLLSILVLSCLVVNSINPNFLTIGNIAVIGLQMSFIGIAAVGTTLLMVGGQLDLSIGSIFGLASISAALLAKVIAPELALLSGIGLGAFLGLCNGLVVWRIRTSPLIVTLGALTFIRGLVMIVSGNKTVAGLPETFSAYGQFRLFGLPSPLLILAAVAIIVGIILSRTTIGLRIQAYGDNREAAELAGVNSTRLMLGLFTFNGLMAGLAGVLAASRLGGAAPNLGVGFELDVITAVILGGVGLSGGEGRIFGVMLAVAVVGVVQAGIVAVGLDPDIGRLCTGGALILAVAVDQFGKERHEARQRRLALEEFTVEGGVADRIGLSSVEQTSSTKRSSWG